MFVIKALAILSLTLFESLKCANFFGCFLDANICESYEYCNSIEFTYGKCESIREFKQKKRLEYLNEAYSDENNYKNPIKIHKYHNNIQDYDYDFKNNINEENDQQLNQITLKNIYTPDYVDFENEESTKKQQQETNQLKKRELKRNFEGDYYYSVYEEPSLDRRLVHGDSLLQVNNHNHELSEILLGAQFSDEYEQLRQQEIYERLLDLVNQRNTFNEQQKQTQNVVDINDDEYDEYIKDYLTKINHVYNLNEHVFDANNHNDDDDDDVVVVVESSNNDDPRLLFKQQEQNKYTTNLLNDLNSFELFEQNDNIHDTKNEREEPFDEQTLPDYFVKDIPSENDDDYLADDYHTITRHMSRLNKALHQMRNNDPILIIEKVEIVNPLNAQNELKHDYSSENSFEAIDTTNESTPIEDIFTSTELNVLAKISSEADSTENESFITESMETVASSSERENESQQDEVPTWKRIDKLLEEEEIQNENEDEDLYALVRIDKTFANATDAVRLLRAISKVVQIPINNFQNISIDKSQISFKIKSNLKHKQTKDVVAEISNKKNEISKKSGFNILASQTSSLNDQINSPFLYQVEKKPLVRDLLHSKYFVFATIAICSSTFTILIFLIALYLLRRRAHLRNKLIDSVFSPSESNAYSFNGDNKSDKKNLLFLSEKNEIRKGPLVVEEENKCDQSTLVINTLAMCDSSFDEKTPVTSPKYVQTQVDRMDPLVESQRSSTSSWSDEPIAIINMDVTTGHLILNYMESHLNDKNKITSEWKSLCEYVSDLNEESLIAQLPSNMDKNRYRDILPYDRNRILLKSSDRNYINASAIADTDPKHVVYIATQGPLVHTTIDFWQMAWDQCVSTIVCLTRPTENGVFKCNQYWPSSGSVVYERFEINLVSEHVWCEDYLVRSFYLKNMVTNETRTITQFHYLTWSENELPTNIKSLLDFRRKVNKSYKNALCPIVVHCNDGIARTGTYILIDMVLNRILKGAKEIDIAATCEFLRDQRTHMVKSQKQFEFSFAVIAEELQNMLKALSLSIQ